MVGKYVWLIGVIGLFLSPCSAQKNEATIDVLHYQFSLILHESDDTIEGNAQIKFKVLLPTSVVRFELASVDSTGKGMHVDSIRRMGQPLTFEHRGDTITIFYSSDLQQGQEEQISVGYRGVPADGLIISTNKYGHRTFFGDNWPNRAHQWLPCVDHPWDKASVDFIVTAPDHFQVISNGVQTELDNLPDHMKLTHYQETVPLPTKVMVIGAADFAVNYAADVECIPIYSWVYPEDRAKGFVEYARAKDILPYYIKQIGPYPYRKLANVQSKTRFGGMENANAIFYFENSLLDKVQIESLLAHEIAHQWFGNSATEMNWADLWLSEGFATYMTNLYLESTEGADTLAARLRRDRQKVIEFSRIKAWPVVDTGFKGSLVDLLNANSYQKGSWVLHMLRRRLGTEIFWQGIRKYYQTYAGLNATTLDFRKVMEEVSGQNLDQFFHQWLYTPGQPKLNVRWTYDTTQKQLLIQVEQRQSNLFEFPLQLMATSGSEIKTASYAIKDRRTEVRLPFSKRPSQLVADPYTNLLFEADITSF